MIALTLLGGFRLSRQDKPLGIKMRKSKALLSWLALNADDVTSRDRLAGLLWDDRSMTQARQSVRQSLTDIRRALGEDADCLIADADTVRLDVERVRCDAIDFLAAIAGGASETAASLYGGCLLEGFVPNAPSFEQWLALEQERFERLAVENLEALMQRAEGADATDEVLRYARMLLRLDPLREDAHRRVMRSLAVLGRTSDAIKQYNACRAMLMRELGVPPDAATHALHAEILALRRDAVASGAAEPTPASQVPELRQATVLALCTRNYDDLVDSLAPADLERALSEARAIVAEAFESYGCIVPRADDQVAVAVFGITGSLGTHIDHAVRAGQDLQRRLAHLEVEFAFAVATGQLMTRGLAGEQDPQVSGSALNQAVELARQAQPGDLIAPSNVIHGLGVPIDHEALEQPSAAGVCCVVRLGEFDKEPRFPMVGRAFEKTQILASAEACRSTGTGHAVLVRGMAGMGKSRLISACLDELRDGEWVIAYAELLETSLGDANVPHLTRSLMALEEGVDTDWLKQGGLTERALTMDDYPVMCRLLGLSSDTVPSHRDIRVTLDRIAARIAGVRPLVAVIEDIHWGDAETLRLVADLISIAADYPMLIILSTRIENEPLDPQWRSAFNDTPLFTIDLGPLREPEAREHCWALVDAEPGLERSSRVEAIVERCLTRAQGHPLFLEQCLRALLFTNDELPLSVLSIVEARLDQLPPFEREGVLVASVLGPRFPKQALDELHGKVDMSLLHHQRLLRQHGDELLFEHGLLREGVYRTLLNAKKRELHRQAARWYQAQNSMAWARHLVGAGDDRAPVECLQIAQSELDGDRPDRAAEILSWLRDLEVDHQVKREVLKLSNRLELVE